MNKAQTTKNNFIVLIGIFVLVFCVIMACVFWGVNSIFSEPQTTDEYMKEYGGNPDVYNRILNGTDCTALQNEFNQADENLKLQEPGTPQYKWGLGYMKAVDQRMKEIGCYK